MLSSKRKELLLRTITFALAAVWVRRWSPSLLWRWLVISVAALLLVWLGSIMRARILAGPYQQLTFYRPTVKTGAVVILFADVSQSLDELIRQILNRGAIVAAIRPERYLADMANPCQARNALAEDVGQLTKRILKRANIAAFVPPILIGLGSQARLVEEIVAASTMSGLSGAIVQTQSSQPPSHFEHCSKPSANRFSVRVQHVASVGSDTALLATLEPLIHSDTARSAGLPLIEYPVEGAQRAVILLSGDGGWREIDHGMALAFQRQHIAVIGWNSLPYFWSLKTPHQLSDDLAQVIRAYQTRWQIRHFALVGYSFGADVAPFAYVGLAAPERQRIDLIAMLGLEATADFKIRIGGWLGWGNRGTLPVMDAVAHVDGKKQLCVFGAHEKKSFCRALQPLGVERIERPGGHHFDHNTTALANAIIAKWDKVSDAAIIPAIRPIPPHPLVSPQGISP